VIDLGRVRDWWRRFPVTVQDLPLALALVAASLVPPLQSHGTELGDLPNRPLDGLALAVIAIEGLPLAVRRVSPALCLALVAAGFAADQLLGYHTVAGTALPIALMSTALHLRRHRRTMIVLTSVAYVPLSVLLYRQGSTEGVVGFTTFYLALALAWGIGAWLRLTRAAEEERRRHVAEASRAAERTRIARELHDVVTHHVTAMVVQAEAARYLTAAPDRLDQALSAVSDTGRQAIGDLRQLLELLNPSTGELHALVERTRRAGQPVEFTEHGRPRGSDADATAYRVVQEALTNALKHAHGSRTEVHVDHGPKEIVVEVSTDGSGSGGASPGGSGRGLAGLRERVGLLGGEFDADRRADGGFVVRARIPAAS
jgi:signal transduction histidine kinase